MELFRAVRSGSLVTMLLLLSAGCGLSVSTSAAPSGQVSERPTDSATPSPDSASPSPEGTGTDTPQQSTAETNAVFLPSLPIGTTGPLPSKGNVGCFDLEFLFGRDPLPPGAVMKVTTAVVNGPFTLADVGTTSCLGDRSRPSCAGLQLRTSINASCIFAVVWKGTGWSESSDSVRGWVSLKGIIDCSSADRPACLRYASRLQHTAPTRIAFYFQPGSDTGSPSPTPTGSASPTPTGSASPTSTGSVTSTDPASASLTPTGPASPAPTVP